ncbi:MAG: class I SAM-dependent methyltransferase [Gammaproteobacteria bacterium]
MSDSPHVLGKAYRPTHDESARQAFVGALKGYVNGPLEAQLATEYDNKLQFEFIEQHGQAPQDRNQGTEAFRHSRLYQLWGSAVFTSQNLMWETVGETCDRLEPAFQARRATLAKQPSLGTLELADDFVPPDPIRHVEIHRQPGGYFGPSGSTDLHRGMHYFGTTELYRNAKGLGQGSAAGEPNMGRYLLGALQRRFNDVNPGAVLDLGCGPGTETLAYKAAYPEAEVWGVDLSAPFLRFGHLWAEDQGMAINFRQANASDTGLPSGKFDLIISHILFHETWDDILPAIMAEAYRLLAPGGVFINGDTPYQPERLSIPKQVTNHWQVINNGEPFWSGFADTDVKAALVDAGFAPANAFAEYDPLGAGEYFIFGGAKEPVS